ncbi:TerB family tellurite resistance protein [Cellulophaga fucicola]|uniref:tellurite resistance TerB family protein n=1 Tax=Cellulophaga fucicola TaxID=76595 RepID=UPI003EB7CCDB
MSFVDLYGNSEHRKNVAHFASIASLASIDGEINEAEKVVLDRFARKLDITEAEYKEVMKNPGKYPIDPPTNLDRRLERMFDLFKIIFADHDIDEDERLLIRKYAIGLGYSTEAAEKVISRSVVIFSGKLDFDDYAMLVRK